MRLLSKLSFLFLFVALVFVSCDRDNMDETLIPDTNFEPEVVVVNNLINALTTTSEDNGLELGCFSIDFPFSLLLEDGTTVEVFTIEEFEDVTSQESPFMVVDFVFPLTLTTAEDESVQVNSNEELALQFASCIPDEGWDDATEEGSAVIPAFLFEDLCFDLVYPVDLEDTDGHTYTANNEVELIDLCITVPNLFFTLPFTVTDEDGEEVVIESVAGFYDLFWDCEGNTPPGTEGGITIDLIDLDSANCDFETLAIQYPYDVLTEDGELITVEDENEEAALILSGEDYTVQYPFNLIAGDSQIITINNDEEFILFILPCLVTIEEPEPCSTPAHVFLWFNQGGGCGVVDYPNQITAGGIVYDINDIDEYFVVYNQYAWDEIDIVYPISVTETDGTVVTFNSDQEICDYINECA
ncbi:MAG: hypothetical protein AAFR36_14320 [Bacteroidota bacterium]